ncbi:conserved hypothetical protein [Bordetella avium 197N]|uniref:Uncharacterized protein n=1 Tax=Bordetella avium (strain 197N) TaxID=360910 RepID=Q2KXQ8_BORA1|nr:conserved hypothetical protein [Bordetella avium 197N]
MSPTWYLPDFYSGILFSGILNGKPRNNNSGFHIAGMQFLYFRSCGERGPNLQGLHIGIPAIHFACLLDPSAAFRFWHQKKPFPKEA